jgi:hypothetical protein
MLALFAVALVACGGERPAEEPRNGLIAAANEDMDADGKNARPITKGGFGPPSWAPKG